MSLYDRAGGKSVSSTAGNIAQLKAGQINGIIGAVVQFDVIAAAPVRIGKACVGGKNFIDVNGVEMSAAVCGETEQSPAYSDQGSSDGQPYKQPFWGYSPCF